MNIIHALILGIVEGITEFLPISSTGHLIIASHLLALQQSEFLKSFEIVIQLGAILAVIVLYWKKIWRKRTIGLLIVGFIPTGIIGLIFYKIVKEYLLGNSAVVIAMMILGGIVLIIFELLYKRRAQRMDTIPALATITYRQAFALGFFQAIAIIPGVSRSAATIVGGLYLGIERKTIVEFSFLLAIPTMIAASGLDLVKSGASFSGGEYELLIVGFIAAFITALFSIKFLLRFVKTHTFIPFGIYRIVAGVLFAFLIL